MKVQKFVIDGEDIEVKDTQARNNIGDLSDLDTTNKNNLVEAINEVSSSGGVESYDDLTNKPSINGVTLSGNKTTSDLHIQAGGVSDYDDLDNKPSINGVTLSGNKTTSDLNIEYDNLTNRPVESGNVDMDSIVNPLPPIATEEKVLFDERGTEYTVGWYVNSSAKRKPVYQKTLKDLICPNNSSVKNYAHGIANVDYIYVKNANFNWGNRLFSPIPAHSSGASQTVNNCVMAITTIDNTNISVRTDSDRSEFTFDVTIQYTKTTDAWEDIPS